jgi:hypothetical protein
MGNEENGTRGCFERFRPPFGLIVREQQARLRPWSAAAPKPGTREPGTSETMIGSRFRILVPPR